MEYFDIELMQIRSMFVLMSAYLWEGGMNSIKYQVNNKK